MKASEVEVILKDQRRIARDTGEGYSTYGNWLYEQIYGGAADIQGLGRVQLVEQHGGEGQGDQYWMVFRIGEQLFRIDGWYASYDGGYLDGEVYEVKPQLVQVTEYVKA